MTSPLTTQQENAVQASRNCLLIAGAGTGKTRVLVERCLNAIRHRPVSVESVFVVTFTDAAATEMKKRLRLALEEVVKAEPDNPYLAEQLALLDTAHIGTLHSFCRKLLREHFFELNLDPSASILAPEKVHALQRRALDLVLQRHYDLKSDISLLIQTAVSGEGKNNDATVRERLLLIHQYTQALPHPERWLQTQIGELRKTDGSLWRKCYEEALLEWRNHWVNDPPLVNDGVFSPVITLLHGIQNPLSQLKIGPLLEEILAEKAKLDKKQIAKVETFFDEAGFFRTLAGNDGKPDPLQQDLEWSQPYLIAWLQLAREFADEFSALKRQAAVLDFNDLEQLSLRLLWDAQLNQPTPTALRWRKRLNLVLVDEYQDINAVQDKIISALAGENETSNRFLVGDVKQSIYRFRLADPSIFQNYEKWWRNEPFSQCLFLQENFRSHEAILQFVNSAFSLLMQPRFGGLTYGEDSCLRFGNREGRSHLTRDHDPSPRVELHILKSGKDTDSEDAPSVEALPALTREARHLASRFLEMMDQKLPIWDGGRTRPVQWSDMVVLFRAPREKIEGYAREFSHLGVPVHAARTGFYESTEVNDVLNLLRVLDNPEQDLPLLALLRSPFGGFSADDLAEIRMADRDTCLWKAFLQFQQAPSSANASSRADRLLQSLARWRKLLRRCTVGETLESITEETFFLEWLLSKSMQQRANVEKLIAVAREFDPDQRDGLLQFLLYVDSQVDAGDESEPAVVGVNDAVRFLSIHQSKGLEFPVVAVADLGKPFNLGDLRNKIILDAFYGLTSPVISPGSSGTYPSLPYWLAQKRQRLQLLGEEIRLLYVAFTRATERLILSGTSTVKSIEGKWPSMISPGSVDVGRARSALDWIGAWAVNFLGQSEWTEKGEKDFLQWDVYSEQSANARESLALASKRETTNSIPTISLDLDAMRWKYPQLESIAIAAKTSVSKLSERLLAGLNEDKDVEAQQLWQFREPLSEFADARLLGNAHHRFLEIASLAEELDSDYLRAQAATLCKSGMLTDEEVIALDFEAMAEFWRAPAGQMILRHPKEIHRELPFAFRFSASDLPGAAKPQDLADEFVIIQGAVDLAVILPSEIWVLDFKTDSLQLSEIVERVNLYRPQMELYSKALASIYRRPVTRAWLHFLMAGHTAEI